MIAGALAIVLAGCAAASKPVAPSKVAVANRPALASVINLELQAEAFAPEKIKVAIYLPPGYDPASSIRYPVLYLNDGQDAASLGLQQTLAGLYERDEIREIIVVAIDMLPDRMGIYGLSDRAAHRSKPGESRFGMVGSHAHDYSQWVALQLVPYIDAQYHTSAKPQDRAMAGWSLGALNAFNLGWQYPELFGKVGAFSPSFWLASDRGDIASIQRTRLAQGMVEAGPRRDAMRLWMGVGTDEETDDRDGDGVIDVVDDTQDLARALARQGYAIDFTYAPQGHGNQPVALYLLQGGHHDQASWARMLPMFLRWAFANGAHP